MVVAAGPAGRADRLGDVAGRRRPEGRVPATSPAGSSSRIGGEPAATYVYRDETITRPYFAHVHAPGGMPLTRNHPPIAGTDPTDHAALHPGLWLAFGDLSGADDWRNRRGSSTRVRRAPSRGPGRGRSPSATATDRRAARPPSAGRSAATRSSSARPGRC